MKETEQTLLDQIKDQVAKENGGYKYHRSILNDEFWRIVCERYATAKAKASCEATLRNTRHNVFVKNDHVDKRVIDSIVDPSNIVIV